MMRRRRNQAYTGCRMTGLRYPRIHLSARKLTSLTWLCTLCHLDLDFLRADQIAGSHAKTSGCHLLNSRTAIIIPRSRNKTIQTLTALTRIGFAAQSVHGDCQRLMCFLRNGTIRHRTGLKPFHNRIHTLNLFDRNAAVLVKFEIDQAAQVDGLAFFIECMTVFFKQIIIAGSGGFLKQMDCARIIKMLFLSCTLLMASYTVKSQIHIQPQRIKCSGMQHIYVICNIFQGNAAHTAYGIGKVFVDHFL